jgi:polysaccharide export outer membrane protein
MKTSPQAKRNRWSLAMCLAAATILLPGCSHLTYVDPNPSQPYAFPSQPSQKTTAPMVRGPNTTPMGTDNRLPVVPNNSIPATPVVAANPMPGLSRPAASTAVTSGTGFSILNVGDTVMVAFSDTPTLIDIKPQRIGEDGNIKLPYNVTVRAAGKTPGQLQDEIRKEYVPRIFVNLTATVRTEERFYYVGGEVRVPARQPYFGDMTVLRAIDTAGGFTDFADRDKIELRRSGGQKFTIKWKKALQDPKTYDLPVFPNDQVTVHKRSALGF